MINTVGLWLEPAMLPYASLLVVVLTGSVALCNTVSLCHQPIVLEAGNDVFNNTVGL